MGFGRKLAVTYTVALAVVGTVAGTQLGGFLHDYGVRANAKKIELVREANNQWAGAATDINASLSPSDPNRVVWDHNDPSAALRGISAHYGIQGDELRQDYDLEGQVVIDPEMGTGVPKPSGLSPKQERGWPKVALAERAEHATDRMGRRIERLIRIEGDFEGAGIGGRIQALAQGGLDTPLVDETWDNYEPNISLRGETGFGMLYGGLAGGAFGGLSAFLISLPFVGRARRRREQAHQPVR